MEKGALIGRGRTADVYAWGTDRILKLYQAHMPTHLVEQEFRITRAAQVAGIPVPGTDQLVEVDGRSGIIFERLEGLSLLKTLGSQPWSFGNAARLMGELHAQVHGCTAPSDLPSQLQQIENGIQAARDLPANMKEAALSCLVQLPAGSAFCHGDFHPDNILITRRGPVIIDWMTGTRGNPHGDVCRTFLLIETSGLPPGAPLHLRILAKTFNNLLVTTYRNRYLQLCPALPQQINAWRLPLMAARLREVEHFPNETRLLLARIYASLSN